MGPRRAEAHAARPRVSSQSMPLADFFAAFRKATKAEGVTIHFNKEIKDSQREDKLLFHVANNMFRINPRWSNWQRYMAHLCWSGGVPRRVLYLMQAGGMVIARSSLEEFLVKAEGRYTVALVAESLKVFHPAPAHPPSQPRLMQMRARARARAHALPPTLPRPSSSATRRSSVCG